MVVLGGQLGGGRWVRLVVDEGNDIYQLNHPTQCLQGFWAITALHAMQVADQWWTGFLNPFYQFYQFVSTSGPPCTRCKGAPRQADCHQCRPANVLSATLIWSTGRNAGGKSGVLAQLVERVHGMDEVRGSTPLDSTSRFRSLSGFSADRHWVVVVQHFLGHCHVAILPAAPGEVWPLRAASLCFKPHAQA